MFPKVHHAELRPHEFRERLAACPVAYLPLGTLEWHGEHLPLGVDALGPTALFERLATTVGGIVLPPLWVGPDRVRETPDGPLYGMEFITPEYPPTPYPEGRLEGSAYWVPDDLFARLLEAILAQLARNGFRVVVGQGHGPSTACWGRHRAAWEARFGLTLLDAWMDPMPPGEGFLGDHAAANETSVMMASRPELVDLSRLPQDLNAWPRGIAGRDPRTDASATFGERIFAHALESLTHRIHAALARPAGVRSTH
jgi:creatinine amidohydrolase